MCTMTGMAAAASSTHRPGALDITRDFITIVSGQAPTDDEADLLQQAVDQSRIRAQEKETA